MKLKLFLVIIFICSFSYNIFSNDDTIVCDISKLKAKIGEEITISLIVKKIENIDKIENIEVLWKEMNYTHNQAEIKNTENFYKGNELNIKIILCFFNSGEYDNFSVTIPLSTSKGEILYLNTKEYNITIENPLTQEEIEIIKNIKDPSKIQLKKEKKQAKIPFRLTPIMFKILIIIIILLSLIIIGILLYYFIYKILKKKLLGMDTDNLPPYHNFLIKLSRIIFLPEDNRLTIEKKVSYLSEILKELILKEFDLNATSETTKELILNLRKIKFNTDIVSNINRLFTELDLIKFAKAGTTITSLRKYLEEVKLIGEKIYNYKLLIKKDNESNLNSIKEEDK